MNRLLAEFRAEVSGDKLIGHAAVFGQMARLAGGYERLAPSAFDAALAKDSTDVRALLNHDATLLLGRQSAKTLRLSVDSEGLAFEVDLPDTSYANDLRTLVARGDITGASFGFIPGEDEMSRAPDGRQLRTHTSVAELIDVSPVTFPAYDEASVKLRSYTFSERRFTLREQLARHRHTLLTFSPEGPRSQGVTK